VKRGETVGVFFWVCLEWKEIVDLALFDRREKEAVERFECLWEEGFLPVRNRRRECYL
jgi:hypothetical protein